MLFALVSGCTPSATSATPENEINKARLDSTVSYLQSSQNMDGGFGGNAGAPSDPDFSSWVAFALAAAGINPQDQKRPGGVDVFTYLAAHAHELKLTTDFERELLVVDASGTSPHDFGGVDLVHEIIQRQLSGTDREGAFPHEVDSGVPGVNDTIFAILALSPIAEPEVQRSVQRALSWVEHAHDPDGGWPATTVCTAPSSECVSNVDMTGAAIEALNATAEHDPQVQEVQEAAFKYLHEAQNPDGGFPQQKSEPEESNVASTAWAVQGMWAAGQNPETWIKGEGESSSEPLDYMASLQQPDGHIRYQTRLESLGEWMTAEVAPTFAGQALPIPAVPRSKAPSEPPPPGPGVGAGGGGAGAPLFSRPQPQSRGRTPGGVRLLGSKHAARESAAKHRRNPGPPRRAAVPTVTVAGEAGANRSGAHAGQGAGSSGLGGGASGSGAHAGGHEVKGVLIAPDAAIVAGGRLEPAAPGLRSAGISPNRKSWLAIGIACLIALLALVGAQMERHRPQAIL